MAPKIATANRLCDGHVVYLGDDGAWSPEIGRSRIVHGEAAEADLLAAAGAAASEVVELYLIELGDGERTQPLRLRERIRAAGPSVQVALNRSRFSEPYAE